MAVTNSGAKKLVYNTRERLVSDDPNRAQAFQSQALAELFRFILDAQNEEDVSGGGTTSQSGGNETPLAAHVINGLRGRPEVGTVNLFVTAGVALLIDNSAPSTDDSIASLVVDPGVTNSGALTMTAGAGSTRIDVLECQRVQSVMESDNRDVFNAATGLFSAIQVTKVVQGQLVYRLRLGTPGAGYPGNAQGWLPLMVASVPAGAATWDDATCWDVRPLASDRINGPFKTTRLWDSTSRSLLAVDAITNVAQVRVGGEVDLSFKGYKAGGVLRKDSSTAYIDVTDAANQQAGFAGFGTNLGDPWYCYLVFPFGLPRWVRYSDASSGSRAPKAQRGIASVSKSLANFDGTPRTASVQTPAATGLQDPASKNAIVAFAGRSPKAGGATPFGTHCDGKQAMLVNPDAYLRLTTSNTTALARWAFNDSVDFPGPARALYIRISGDFQFPAPAAAAEGAGTILSVVTVSDMSGNDTSQAAVGPGCEGNTYVDSDPGGAGATPGILFHREFVVRVPLQPTFLLNTDRVVHVTWTHSSGITATSPRAEILGWELGP